MSGLDFLKRVSLGERVDLGRRVVVIGGGNTAIDAARTAVRLGAEVSIIYRRTEKEMPAHAREIQEAKEEGVRFEYLTAPERLELDEAGTLNRLVCCRMELGACDADGRPQPVKKPDALFDVTADTVLTAIGETADLDFLKETIPLDGERIPVDDRLRIDIDRVDGAVVLAGGDAAPGERSVVHAVASGKKAAVVADIHRRGLDPAGVLAKITLGRGPAISFSEYLGWPPLNPGRRDLKKVVGSEQMVYDYFEQRPPTTGTLLGPAERIAGFRPYLSTFTDEMARRESDRCLHCGRCVECDNCLIFCPDVSVQAKGGDRFGYWIDYDYCKGCGLCEAECPRGAITMVEEDTPIEEGP